MAVSTRSPWRAAAWSGAAILGCVLIAAPACGDRRSGAGAGSVAAPHVATGEHAAALPPEPPAGYTAELEASRRAKDEAFRHDSDSPVPADERARFHGLEYYAVDPTWRLVLPFERFPRPEPRTLVSNTGERRRMQREGQVSFERSGETIRLTLYRFLDDPVPEGSLWLGFVDAGSGTETYGGGRYLDTELRPDGTVVLDFNLAYNPYCAYGWDYSCPPAPSENRIKIYVRAGERGFHELD